MTDLGQITHSGIIALHMGRKAPPMVVDLSEVNLRAVPPRGEYVQDFSLLSLHHPRSDLWQGYGKDTVRPVTIKQILDAQQAHPDADFKVDGDPISQVC